MGHHVNAHGQFPRRIRGRRRIVDIRIGARNAGIRAEQVDPPEPVLGRPRDALDIRLFRDIRLHRDAANRCRHSLRASAVKVRNNQGSRAFPMKALDHRLADAAGPARDDNNLVRDLHDHPRNSCNEPCQSHARTPAPAFGRKFRRESLQRA